MRELLRRHPSEARLSLALAALCVFLSLASNSFLTPGNLTSLLDNNAVNVIWAVGLLAVLVAGGIDISFAVAASVTQYLCALAFPHLGGGGWIVGVALSAALGALIGCLNAALIHYFRIVSIVVTIATYNAMFGLLMFFTSGRSIYDLPDWWTRPVDLLPWRIPGADLGLPVAAMAAAMAATAVLLSRTNIGRQLTAFGDNPEGARRAGVDPARMLFIAFGWAGAMAGIGGLLQVNLAQEVVPNALLGRELDVLAAVVLGGARLGGGRGSVTGCLLGVLFVATLQNGLNLLGVSPYAFKMMIGIAILVAISTSNIDFSAARAPLRKGAAGA